MTFKQVDPKPDFVKMEKEILDWWYRSGLVKKYLDKNSSSKKRFSFIDGPITANNPMGVHHARGRALKDLYQRYKNMQGFSQRFQNGFDCQGLWVEVEVEKALGFNSKKDIEKFGIDKFTHACIARVNKYTQMQTDQSKRLGYFMDWDNSYYTNSETNNLYIWQFLKKCHQKGLLYQDRSAATWCPRCETGLSKHEQADGYKDITDISVYVKFKIKGKKNSYLLAWTTTPWTLSANVLLAINTKFEYIEVKTGGETLTLAKDSAKRLGLLKDYRSVEGKKLLGLEYDSPYSIPAQKGVRHSVVEWELVNPIEGTGIVHIAPGCGEEDYDLGKKLNISIISPLDQTGKFGEGFGDLSGKYAHNVNTQVIDYLEKQGVLYKTESITHSYPHCWRCGTKCLFRLENNWFINCQSIKADLKKIAKQAKWIPPYAGKRMQNWLDNMADWMISRKRYYGLSLPFYLCSCGELTVIGNKQELKALSLEPKKVDQLPSLHRPWIDEILITCPKCGRKVKRIPEVGDCWLDAGAVPYSTLKYLEDKKYWQKWFPADLVLEMVEQVRLWYYSMLVQSYILEGKVPYLHVANYGEVRDEKGERMSKTKGNGIPFDEAVEKMGADVMRWLYFCQPPESTMNFGYRLADETRRRFHLLLWNIYNFFVVYANVDKVKSQSLKFKSENVLDRWIKSKLNNLIKETTKSLDNYNAYDAIQNIEKFVEDLSTWYVRRSRDRIGPTVKDGKDKNACYQTLWEILATLARLLAPFTPYLAEEIYQNLTGEESVHLSDWPAVGEIDESLEKEMDLVRKICEMGHAARKTAGIKVRQPLKQLTIDNIQRTISSELTQIIKEELNVKQVVFGSGKGELKVKLDPAITPELKADGEARELVRQIQELRKQNDCRLDQKIKVFAPNLPQKKYLLEEVKRSTLATELISGKELKIEKR